MNDAMNNKQHMISVQCRSYNGPFINLESIGLAYFSETS